MIARHTYVCSECGRIVEGDSVTVADCPTHPLATILPTPPAGATRNPPGVLFLVMVDAEGPGASVTIRRSGIERSRAAADATARGWAAEYQAQGYRTRWTIEGIGAACMVAVCG